MAEFFNKYTPDYIKAIKKHNNKYKIKLEVLGYFENVIGEIVKDLSVTAQGQININYQPITRRSCSLTLINVDKKYIPSPNNTFWFERKFQLWIGVVDRSDNIYWWSQGVFFTQSANSDGNTVNIEAIDKGGALDGTLGMNIIDTQYVKPSGTSISRLVKDALMLSITDMPSDKPNGTSKPIDPLTPIIDIKYNNLFTQREISIDAGNSIGKIFEAIGEGVELRDISTLRINGITMTTIVFMGLLILNITLMAKMLLRFIQTPLIEKMFRIRHIIEIQYLLSELRMLV